MIQLEGSKIGKEVSGHLMRLHKAAYDSHEESVASFLSRNIQMAESVRSRRNSFEKLYHEVEEPLNSQPSDASTHLLSVISLMGRIYDNSVDISDLAMPRTH